MKILVTGGSGYLGKHLVSYFGANDLSRRSGLDVLSTSDAFAASEYDVVIHLAARMDRSHETADETFQTNVHGTINLLQAMRRDSVFIFASTKDVYGRFAGAYSEVSEECQTAYAGQSPLEWSKLIAERYVEYYAHQNGLRSCIFRLSNIVAPPSKGNVPGFIGHYAEGIATGKKLRLPGGGRPRRDLLHVDDLAKACEAFTGSIIRHGLYNLGGGVRNSFTLAELVEKIETLSGKKAVIDKEPLPDPVPMNYVTDVSLVRTELDWEPSISIDEALESLLTTTDK
ncbi:MAG: NAD(P)-dependent oxidoreductase [Acidobacteria bacterium]|nr:NAD(P)-dependent oxidoreductase [Acidobacteriota bacterium]